MKIRIILLFLGFYCSTLPAKNDGAYSFMTAGQLLRVCESQEPFQYGACLNYISGTVDTLNMLMDIGAVTADAYCLPANITQTRLRFVTIEYLKKAPAVHHYLAADQVARALDMAFPCQQPAD